MSTAKQDCIPMKHHTIRTSLKKRQHCKCPGEFEREIGIDERATGAKIEPGKLGKEKLAKDTKPPKPKFERGSPFQSIILYFLAHIEVLLGKKKQAAGENALKGENLLAAWTIREGGSPASASRSENASGFEIHGAPPFRGTKRWAEIICLPNVSKMFKLLERCAAKEILAFWGGSGYPLRGGSGPSPW